MPRLFVAVNLADEVNERIAGLARAELARNIAWIPAPRLHLTLKFIGSVQDALIAPIKAVLESCASELPFDLRAIGTGTFPGGRRPPQVAWVGIEDPSGHLGRLAQDLDSRLSALGIKPETRAYSPHITIGRVKSGKPQLDFLDEFRTTDFGTSRVTELVLYRSETLPSGAVYTRVATVAHASNVVI